MDRTAGPGEGAERDPDRLQVLESPFPARPIRAHGPPPALVQSPCVESSAEGHATHQKWQ